MDDRARIVVTALGAAVALLAATTYREHIDELMFAAVVWTALALLLRL